MFERAQGRCEVTGIPFNDTLLSGRVRPWKASIDRIDSEEGYHPENCRLVCVAVNAAMREWGEQILWTIANALVSRILERAYVEEEGPEGRPREMGGEENAGVA